MDICHPWTTTCGTSTGAHWHPHHNAGPWPHPFWLCGTCSVSSLHGICSIQLKGVWPHSLSCHPKSTHNQTNTQFISCWSADAQDYSRKGGTCVGYEWNPLAGLLGESIMTLACILHVLKSALTILYYHEPWITLQIQSQLKLAIKLCDFEGLVYSTQLCFVKR